MTIQRATAIHKALSKKSYSKLAQYEKELLREVAQRIRAHMKRNPDFNVSSKVERGGTSTITVSPTRTSTETIESPVNTMTRTRTSTSTDTRSPSTTSTRTGSTRTGALANRRKQNPGNPVLIYARVLRVEAQKGPGHRCDAGCKRSNHCYFHDFSKGANAKALGLPDGSVLLKGSKRLWGMF